MIDRRPYAILTRHFLRRFLENDLLSADADRSHLIAVIGAACFSTTVFVTVMMSCFKYVVGYFTPAQVAVSSLDDKFFYIGLSMIVSALLAVMQWDALVIDQRDAAILEPLPIRPLAIRRAKLAAVAILGTAAAIVLNLVPSVVFPMLMLVKQRVGLLDALWIVATHAVITMAAAAFGYMVVIAVRESLTAVLGRRLFATVSPVVQGLLVIIVGSMLLLLPGHAIRVERRTLSASTALMPPAWFLGAYEVSAGRIVADAPRSGRLTRRQLEADAKAAIVYDTHTVQFEALARIAWSALGGVFALAAAAYAWNARRLPQLAPPPAPADHRHARLWTVVARTIAGREPAVRAGFHFTLATLWRSGTHRLTLAGAAAAAMAIGIVAISGIDLREVAVGSRDLTRLLIVQPFLYGALLLGYRHAVRVPAELRGNWHFELAWRDERRQFLAGSRRAAIVALVLPALVVVMPLVAFALGPLAAIAHAALGLAGALFVIELLLLRFDKVPFTCAYVPSEHMKAIGPIGVFAFFIGATAFARMEGRALGDAGTFAWAIAELLAATVALRLVSSRHQLRAPIDFNEAPETTQRLGLHA